MTKENPMKFKVALGLVLLALVASGTTPGQPQPETKTLIVPIYFQVRPFDTTFIITEASGRQVDVDVEEYTSNGRQTVSKSFDGGVEENGWWFVFASLDLTPPWIDNGWAKIIYPEDRDVRVVSTMYDKNIPESGSNFTAVPPSPSFRLMTHSTSRSETAIVIVNPTEEEQDLRLLFYGWDRRKGQGLTKFRTRGWARIAPKHSLSRFLTELVPQILTYANEAGSIGGLLKISGDTEIAVGALDYYRETGRFKSVPVVVESDLGGLGD
jgi:hypothetical protein